MNPDGADQDRSRGPDQPSITVAIVSICGPAHLSRCLDALRDQDVSTPFDVVVAYDPALHGIEELAPRYPEARLFSNVGQRTPLELASRAVAASGGDVVLLTEDHCVPDPHWVSRLSGALSPGDAAVGGSVTTDLGASPLDFAFYFVDFFRYAPPVTPGPSPSLTVCNVAYRRKALLDLRDLWSDIFHETAVNSAIRDRHGPLRLIADAPVSMRRHVRLGDALYERYAFGRLFGCTRLEFEPPGRRLLYTVASPALPALILSRMIRKVIRAPGLRWPFTRALLHLVLLIGAWSWGEWLGYLTRKRPARLTVAQEEPGPAP